MVTINATISHQTLTEDFWALYLKLTLNDILMNAKLCLNADEEKEIQGSNTQKPSLENDKTSANDTKSVNRKKRKSNVEKSLEVVMKKFQESSDEDFKR
jgi:hypothetical protein